MGRSDKWWEIYHALIREGYSKERAAKIAHHTEQQMKEEKGVDDGQYYREPLETYLPSRGRIVQPQNPKPKDEPKRMPLEADKFNKINCPYCGHPSLTEEANVDTLFGEEKRWRCNFCQAYLTEQELLDNDVLESLTHTMEGNTNTEAVTIPKWSPKHAKNCKCDLHKEIDLNMNVKSFVGFDYIKSWDKIAEYISSKKYKSLLNEYLKDLSDFQIKRIINILKTGIKQQLSVKEIAKKIENIIKDKARSKIIAKTETVRITNEGYMADVEEKGEEKVKWFSAPEDGRRCELCADRNRKVYTIKSLKGKIPLHPNCRCFVRTFAE
jgi:SPP1 gp7 family putative phage head morphogenesis protein